MTATGRTVGPASEQGGRATLLAAVLRHGPMVAVAVPAVAALGNALTTDWLPAGDVALEALRTADVGTARTPLVGAYSRFGWSHPGPLLFWLGSPFHHVLGPRGLLVEAVLVNLASALVAVTAARRVGGRAAAWLVAGATLAAVGAVGAPALLEIWNPFVAMLPLLAFLLSVAAAADGHRPSLVAAAATGTFAVQCHVGSAPVVLAALVGGGAWVLHRRRTEAAAPAGPGATDAARRWWVWGAVAAVVLVLAWSGPLVEQVANDPGNLREMATFALDGEEAPAPLSDAVGVAARELGVPPAWLVGRETVEELPIVAAGAPWTLGVVAAALAVAATWALRRGDGPAARLVLLSAWLWLVSLVALTRNVGLYIPYLVRWTWPVGILVAVAPALTGWRALAPTLGRRSAAASRAAAPVAVVVVLAASAGLAVRSLGDRAEPDRPQGEAVRALADAIDGAVPEGSYAYRWADPHDLGSVPVGVAVELERRGYDLVLPPERSLLFGEERVGPGDELPRLVVVAERAGAVGPPAPGAEEVTRADALSPAERARLDEVEARIRRDADLPADRPVVVDSIVTARDLEAAGASAADTRAALDLQREGDAYRVWLVPAPAG